MFFYPRVERTSCYSTAPLSSDSRAAIDSDTLGGSYAAIQHWVHDLSGFKVLPQEEQDALV